MKSFQTRIFADGADKAGMLEMYRNPLIAGFTTNPTLMRKAGISDYEAFAHDIIKAIPDRPLSFEVFSDEFADMEKQARRITTWGSNVFVKIPITNTKGESCAPLIAKLSASGIRMNITAMLTMDQVREIVPCLAKGPESYVSVFAGRIADAGQDPLPIMREAVACLKPYPQLSLIWASPREILNLVQADQIGCQIITMTNDLIKKIPLLGKDLTEYSLDTVKMFYKDALDARFAISV